MPPCRRYLRLGEFSGVNGHGACLRYGTTQGPCRPSRKPAARVAPAAFQVKVGGLSGGRDVGTPNVRCTHFGTPFGYVRSERSFQSPSKIAAERASDSQRTAPNNYGTEG